MGFITSDPMQDSISNVQHVLPSSKKHFSNNQMPFAHTQGWCLSIRHFTNMPNLATELSFLRRERWVCCLHSNLQIPQLSTQRQTAPISRPQSPQQAPRPHLNSLVESRFCLPKADYGRALFHKPCFSKGS